MYIINGQGVKMDITINGKVYDFESLTPEQRGLLNQLKLAETLGELMNHAHDEVTRLIMESFDGDEA
jgi:hypothetical protein